MSDRPDTVSDDRKVLLFEYAFGENVRKIKETFTQKFVFNPAVIILLTNIIALIVLLAISFWIGIGITSNNLKTYNEPCNKDIECDYNLNLRCQEGICNCTSTQFYTSVLYGCVEKYENLVQCYQKDQCKGDQLCINNKCQCTSDRWWNSSTLYCQKKSEYDQYCLTVDQCANGKNLVCLSSRCRCSNANVVFWNGTYCDAVQTYLGNCKINAGCNPAQRLTCNITESYPYKCVCPPYNYWNPTSNICLAQKLEGVSCSASYECYSNSGLYCGLSAGVTKCICQANHYWSSTPKLCIQRHDYGDQCSATRLCDNTLLLQCNAALYCDCPSTLFWNGTCCVPPILSGINCNNNFECDASKGLYCHSSYKQCVCQSTHYWEDSTDMCAFKKIEKEFCKKTIECQDYNLLYCDTGTGKCECPWNYYWSSKCYVKKDINVACVNNIECKDYLGLTCRDGGLTYKYCECPNSKFWNGAGCVDKYHYDISCSDDVNCKDWLGLICDNKCQCKHDYYWDGTKCVIKKTFRTSCGQDYECKEHLGLYCLTDSRFGAGTYCTCTPYLYWDSTSCVYKKTESDNTCTGTATYPDCKDYAGLACYGGICRCDQRYYYWVTNKCQPFMTINKYCDSSVRCNTVTQGLQCTNSPNVCQCPYGDTWSYALSKCV